MSDENLEEPIAVVGIGCRFPRASNLQEFWEMLLEEREGIGEAPKDRYDIDRHYHPNAEEHPRTISTRRLGTVDNLYGFDAAFFGFPSYVATVTDPQVRLLLEATWNAFEDAGMPYEEINGENGGIFVGSMYDDYGKAMGRYKYDIDVYSLTGASTAPGRIGHHFNITGPSLQVDTACASSLTAAQLACDSLKTRQSDFAVVGGSNVVQLPDISFGYSRADMLNPEGVVRFGDADANGLVRGEGIGVVVLKRLEDALEDQNRIYALIRGWAINNDANLGSGGFMTPSRVGQRKTLSEVYEDRHVDLSDLRYVEAHGTGTPVGDPIEISALDDVVGSPRPGDERLPIGSVKTNIGHTEGAAGIANLIKASVSLKEGIVPPSLHFERPTPKLDWDELSVDVLTEPLELREGRNLMGVSAFGLSQTTTHLLLENWRPEEWTSAAAPPPTLEAEREEESVYWLPVSGHVPEAVRQNAERRKSMLGERDTDEVGELSELLEGGLFTEAVDSLHDLCYTAIHRHTHHEFRSVAVGRDRTELLAALDTIAEGEEGESIRETMPHSKAALVFSGMGSQRPAMGLELAREEPEFADKFEECDAIIESKAGWSLIEVLEDGGWTDSTDKVQPIICAFQIASAHLLEAYGFEPDAVIGHSVGEIAAGHVAGILGLEDALGLAVDRSELLVEYGEGRGVTGAVGLPASEVEERLDGYEESELTFAVSNGPSSSVVSGEEWALEEFFEELDADNVFHARVDASYAVHSPHLDPVRDELFERLQGEIEPNHPSLPFFSTAEGGRVADDRRLGAEYWSEAVRNPVWFSDAVEEMSDAGFGLYVEVCGRPVLDYPLGEIFEDRTGAHSRFSLTREDSDEVVDFFEGLGALFQRGGLEDAPRLYEEGTVVTLPRYAFQREHFNFERDYKEHGGDGKGAYDGFPFLTEKVALSRPGLTRGEGGELRVWEMPVDIEKFPFLQEHRVRGTVRVPKSFFLALATTIGDQIFGEADVQVRDFHFEGLVRVDSGLRLQLVLTSSGEKSSELEIFRMAEEGRTLVAQGRVTTEHVASEAAGEDTESGATPAADQAMEVLQLEFERRRYNPDYQFAVVLFEIDRESGEKFISDQDALESIHRGMRDAVRAGDRLFWIAENRCLLLARGVDSSRKAQMVAKRVGDGLAELLEIHADAVEFKVGVCFDNLEYFDGVEDVVRSAEEAAQRFREQEGPLDPLASSGGEFEVIDGVDFYEKIEKTGLELGELMRGLRCAKIGEAFGEFEIEIPRGIWQDRSQYHVHPGILDCCLRPLIAARGNRADSGASWEEQDFEGLQFSLEHSEGMEVYAPVDSQSLTVRYWQRGESEPPPSFDVNVYNDRGELLWNIAGFRGALRDASEGDADEVLDRWFYRWDWEELSGREPAEIEEGAFESETWVIFEDEHGAGRLLRATLSMYGAECITIRQAEMVGKLGANTYGVNPDTPSMLPKLIDVIESNAESEGRQIGGFVYFWGYGQEEDVEDRRTDEIFEEVNRSTATLISLVQVLQSSPGLNSDLWLVTSGCSECTGRTGRNVVQGPALAVMRTLHSEDPAQGAHVVDLESRSSQRSIERLTAELVDSSDEVEIALSSDGRYARRMEGVNVSDMTHGRSFQRTFGGDDSKNYRLESRLGVDGPGIYVTEEQRRDPGDDEVEISVEFSGLASDRYRDGTLVDFVDRSARPGVGVFAFGRIERTGDDVEGVREGEGATVVAPTDRSGEAVSGASNRLVVNADQLLTGTRAGGAPDRVKRLWPYLRAYYQLFELGNLDATGTLLLNGVGPPVALAAGHLALHEGSEVLAVAESEEDRRRLVELGVHRCWLADEPNLVEIIEDMTDGEGVDVILQHEQADAVGGSGRLLKPGGTLVEAVQTPAAIGTAEQRPNLEHSLMERVPAGTGYHRANLGSTVSSNPALGHRLAASLMERFASLEGVEHLFDVEELTCESYFEQERREPGADRPHILAFGKERLEIDTVPADEEMIREDSSYLLTGGTGGIGLVTADWLSREGAGTVILVSRSGVKEGTEEQIEAIRERGTDVVIKSVDLTDRADVEEMLEEVRSGEQKLRGVFHLAGVYEQAAIRDLEFDTLEFILGPKVQGAWNLHELTKDFSLDYFVLFSSQSALFGLHGTCAYGASNCFLDELAHHRNRLGEPALSLNWCLWSVGMGEEMASELEERGLSHDRSGFGIIDRDLGQRALDVVMKRETGPQLGICRFDTERLTTTTPFATTPIFERVTRMSEPDSEPGIEEVDWRSVIEEESDEEARLERSRECVAAVVGEVVGRDPDRLQMRKSAGALGVDSMMAVEIRNRIDDELGVELSPEMIIDSEMEALAAAVQSELSDADSASDEEIDWEEEADLDFAEDDFSLDEDSSLGSTEDHDAAGE